MKNQNMPLKPGYQNKPDPLRDPFKLQGNIPEVIISKSKVNMPPSPENRFKKGGKVGCLDKFAYGGAAKVRLSQATSSGMPKMPRNKSMRKK